jgi:hypothetical protein
MMIVRDQFGMIWSENIPGISFLKSQVILYQFVLQLASKTSVFVTPRGRSWKMNDFRLISISVLVSVQRATNGACLHNPHFSSGPWCGEVTRLLQSGIDWYHPLKPHHVVDTSVLYLTSITVFSRWSTAVKRTVAQECDSMAPICTRGTKGGPIHSSVCWVRPEGSE